MENEQGFTEYDVPVLYKVIAITQPEDDISLEFWDHVVELYEFQTQQKIDSIPSSQNSQEEEESRSKMVQLLFAKGKEGYLMIWKFESGCLMYQKNIKIPYAATKEITAIKAFSVKGSDSGNKHETIKLLLIGYFDGITELYVVKVNQNSVSLSKCLSIHNTTQEPVTNFAIYDNTNLYVCRSHYIYLYPQLISDLYKKVVTKSKEQLNCTETLLRIKELNDSSKISMFLSETNLHIYNEMEGLFSFTVPEMESSGSIIDSVKTLIQTPEADIVLGSADDSVKIIYAQSNEIERFIGLKSFISTITVNEIPQQKLLQLWMGDMYGEIHYMLKTKLRSITKNEAMKLKSDQKANEMVLYEEELNRSLKINENGIKKILIATNLLVVQDTQMNILVYDVVRNLNSFTARSNI